MWQAITDIINKAQSELFMFLILLVLLLIVMMKPILTYFRERKVQELAREQNILTVVQSNSTIMAELKTLLKDSNDNCKECKADQLQAFQRLEDNQNASLTVLSHVSQDMTVVLERVGRCVKNA